MGELRGLHAIGAFVPSGERLRGRGGNPDTSKARPAALHAVWKTAQTLMEYLSGIATSTADIVAAARRGNPAASVVCTRKNFPGTKAAAMKAVLCAGASPHRLSLSETLLVFPEHRAFLADEAPAATVARLRRQWPERAVVVEVAERRRSGHSGRRPAPTSCNWKNCRRRRSTASIAASRARELLRLGVSMPAMPNPMPAPVPPSSSPARLTSPRRATSRSP